LFFIYDVTTLSTSAHDVAWCSVGSHDVVSAANAVVNDNPAIIAETRRVFFIIIENVRDGKNSKV
jgi:hypothetical protein